MVVNFDNKSLAISDTNIVSGIIALKTDDGTFFPEERWNDNVAALISNWLENTLKLKEKVINEIECYFMDGPFSFKITRGKKEYMLTLFEKRTLVKKMDINFEVFVISLLESARELLKVSKNKNWRFYDLKYLKHTFEKAGTIRFTNDS